jgi:two-component system, NarL family, nitrate/nitrite response regulator NarL
VGGTSALVVPPRLSEDDGGVPLRLLIADNAPTRLGVSLALAEREFVVCSEAETADAAVTAALDTRPDAILLAVDLAGGGIEAAARITAAAPGTPVVMLAPRFSRGQLVASLQAGALGYLVKEEVDPPRLAHALAAVVAGEPALPREVIVGLVEALRHTTSPLMHSWRLTAPDALGSLTPRECEVLDHLVDRHTTREVADRLSISSVTVRRHVSRIARKLGAADRKALLELFEQSPAQRA